MRKVIVVAVREYLAAVKSKAFVITILLAPVLMGGGIMAEKFFDKAGMDTRDRRIAVIDLSGGVFDKLAATAELRNATEVFTLPDEAGAVRQVMPRFLLERAPSPSDEDDEPLLLELSERVRKGELLAFVRISPDVLEFKSEPGDEVNVAYYSNSPTYRDAKEWLRSTLASIVQEWRFAQSGLEDVERVHRALQPPQVEQLGLLERDPVSGEVVRGEKINQVVSALVPVMLVVLMFMVVMMGAGPLIQSVLEEKLQRISEVLLGCIDPFRWMLGKLLGMVAVSLTIVAVYLAGGLFIAGERGVLSLLPVNVFVWFCAYQTLAVLMYGAVFVAAGAACSDHREAQTALTPLMVVIMIPLMLIKTVVNEPNSTLATVMSFIPPVTPTIMLVRQSIPPGIPTWQPVVGMVLVLLTTLACVFAAGRVFRVGILMQGGGVKFRDVLRWILRG